jgi:putative cell wall-binding protein
VNNVTTTVRGTSYGAKILPIKASYYDSNYEAQRFKPAAIVEALNHINNLVDQGVNIKVINISVIGFNQSSTSQMQPLINTLAAKGVLTVAAAGNSGTSAAVYPAALNNVLSVAALNAAATARWPNSSYGSTVDIAAPGENILTTDSSGYAYWSGTSFSSPMVAGIAALVYQRIASLGGTVSHSSVVESILKGTTDNIGVTGIGSGRVNALRAVTDLNLVRLGGNTRYATSELIAKYGRSTASTAVLISGLDENFPDGIAAAGMAGALNAVIISTDPTTLSPNASSALSSLGVSKVITLGAVSATVRSQLAASGKTVVHVAGATRYETAVAAYNYVSASLWGNPNGYRRPDYPASATSWKTPGKKKIAILATGVSFPDGAAAASFAAYAHYPIFLTDGETLSTQVATALQQGGFDELVVIGSPSVISYSVRQQAANCVNPVTLTSMTANTKWWTSLLGDTRCETAASVAWYSVIEGCSNSKVVLSSSTACADSLAASNLRSPLLYIESGNQAAANYIYEYRASVSTVLVVGSLTVVPGPVLSTCISATLG